MPTALLIALACAPDAGADHARGKGMQVQQMSAAAQGRAYEAALRAAFELGPDLSLLADPVYLPRSAGYEGGEAMPDAVIRAMRQRGVVKGSCEPPRDRPREVPVCRAAAPGYVVRFSPPFDAPGDTVQLHLAATVYKTAEAEPAQVLTFERAYQLTGSGDRWRVVREARVPQD